MTTTSEKQNLTEARRLDRAATGAPTTMRRRIATLATAGALAVGGAGVVLPATAVATAAPASAAVESGEEQYIPVSQFGTGLATEAVDCGPAAAVMAMLAEGYTPDDWDADAPAGAISTVRAAIGHDGPTFMTEVSSALGEQGVPATSDTDFTGSLDSVRDGKTAILNGYMDSLPYTYASGNPHIVHWVVVTDYDAGSDTFTVMDSNDGSKHTGVSQAELETFQASVGTAQTQVVVG